MGRTRGHERGLMDKMNQEKLNSADWESLKSLRTIFLSETAGGQKDYWSSSRLLELYHETFAQRIGWKWDAVLKDFSAKAIFNNSIPLPTDSLSKRLMV